MQKRITQFVSLISICLSLTTTGAFARSLSREEIDAYQTRALGRVCIFDATKDVNPKAWVYYADQKTESLKCSPNIDDMQVVSRRMRGYQLGKAVKLDSKFIVSTDEFENRQTFFGRDAWIGRFLQLAMLLKEEYNDPFEPNKKGYALIPEYKQNFVFCMHLNNYDDLRFLRAYFQRHLPDVPSGKPLLILDIQSDPLLQQLSAFDQSFLDTYFDWTCWGTSGDTQKFVEEIKTKMREFERDVESSNPAYKENMRQNILRTLEGICGDFEFKRFAQRLALLLGGIILIAKSEEIVKKLREIEFIDHSFDTLGIKFGSKKLSPLEVRIDKVISFMSLDLQMRDLEKQRFEEQEQQRDQQRRERREDDHRAALIFQEQQEQLRVQLDALRNPARS